MIQKLADLKIGHYKTEDAGLKPGAYIELRGITLGRFGFRF
jgi:hypothetical protein